MGGVSRITEMCRSKFGPDWLALPSADVTVTLPTVLGGEGDFQGRTGLELRRRRLRFSGRWSRGEVECGGGGGGGTRFRERVPPCDCGEFCDRWADSPADTAGRDIPDAILDVSGDGVLECDFLIWWDRILVGVGGRTDTVAEGSILWPNWLESIITFVYSMALQKKKGEQKRKCRQYLFWHTSRRSSHKWHSGRGLLVHQWPPCWGHWCSRYWCSHYWLRYFYCWHGSRWPANCCCCKWAWRTFEPKCNHLPGWSLGSSPTWPGLCGSLNRRIISVISMVGMPDLMRS